MNENCDFSIGKDKFFLLVKVNHSRGESFKIDQYLAVRPVSSQTTILCV